MPAPVTLEPSPGLKKEPKTRNLTGAHWDQQGLPRSGSFTPKEEWLKCKCAFFLQGDPPVHRCSGRESALPCQQARGDAEQRETEGGTAQERLEEKEARDTAEIKIQWERKGERNLGEVGVRDTGKEKRSFIKIVSTGWAECTGRVQGGTMGRVRSGRHCEGAGWAALDRGGVGRHREGACFAFRLSTEASCTDHCKDVPGISPARTDTPGSMIFIPLFLPPGSVSLTLCDLAILQGSVV